MASVNVDAPRLEKDRYNQHALKTERSDQFTRSPAMMDRYH
jgi:hypothetical protein